MAKEGGEEVKQQEIQEHKEQQRSLFKPVSKTVQPELSVSNTVSSSSVSSAVHTASNDGVSSDVSKKDEVINHIYELFIGVCTTLNKVIENIEDYRDKAKDTRNWVEFLRFYESFQTILI